MREAVVEAKLAVGEARDAVARTEGALTQERQRLADAERRGRLAAEIQDRETVNVAQRFAAKHRERAGVLEKKLGALKDELALYERELGDMQGQLVRAERDRPLTEAERSAERAWRELQAAGGARPGTDPEGELLKSQLDRAAREAERTLRVTTPAPGASWFGHPRGLSTLFFTEMWERFSYYGMRGFLILYTTAAVASGGLGFDVAHGANVYKWYTSSVWLTPILGGFIADRFLGQYRSVFLGGAIIAVGHFTLAFESLPSFYTGLALIVLGTGLLKPNISAMVGSLYDQGDARRDAGFSIFYMGINVGAFLGIAGAGWLAQKIDWHIGFAAAGVGMTMGLIQYVVGKRRLQPALDRLAAQRGQVSPLAMGLAEVTIGTRARQLWDSARSFTGEERKRIAAVFVLFVFAALFWGAYEQAGSTLNLFADRYTNLNVCGYVIPSSWLQSVQPIMVITLAPVMAWLWVRLGPREPSSPTKFAIGLLCAGLAF